jgi:phosphatidylglycerophosphatase A
MNQSASIDIRSLKPVERFAYLLATGFGAGLSPIAPGTCGALESVAIFGLLLALGVSSQALLIWLVALSIISLVVGVWASNRICAATQIEDPSQIVIDEVNGQFISLLPLAFAPSVWGVVIAFLLFRLFDIFKPYPINRLEKLPGGLGVMADDVMAGIYAAALVWLAHYWQLI